MIKFIDRETECAALRKRLNSPASLSLVYGQRRVGKTFLLQHMLADEPNTIYFLADESTSAALLRRFHERVMLQERGGSIWSTMQPSDWSTALGLLVQMETTAGRPLVLVFDEFQYLLQTEPAITSVLQRIWDEFHPHGGLSIILCGSALGVLHQLGDSGQPLHGRFDLRMKLRPFGYRETADFVPRWAPQDAFRLYGVFGGLARHLAQVDPDMGLADNAVSAIIDPLGTLHEAPLDLLRTEHLSARRDAEAVLAAIAAGENRFGAIAARTGLTSSRTDYVLKELQAIELIRRDVRFGDRTGSRYARYRCADPLVVFWFKFVQPNRGALLGTSPTQIWHARIAPRIENYMGEVFERIVRQAVVSGTFADAMGPIDTAAPYWSRDGTVEIDLVVASGELRIFIECKWRASSQVDLPDLRQLRDHVARSPWGQPADRLCLASAGGFSERLRIVAEREGVLLLDFSTV